MKPAKKKINKPNIPIVVKSETSEDFFARGKQLVALLDEKKSLPSQRTISFEDPLDLVKFLT